MDQARAARWRIILDKLSAARQYLASAGCLCARQRNGKRLWAVRYVDHSDPVRQRHRAIYVGRDPVLVARAQQWLADVQVDAQADRETQAALQLGAALVKALRRGRQRRVYQTHV